MKENKCMTETWQYLENSGLINNQDRQEFNDNMDKFEYLRQHLSATDNIENLKNKLRELANFTVSSTSGIKMDLFTIPNYNVLASIECGNYFYRAVFFPKDRIIDNQSLFSIRSKKDTTNSGRLHSPHNPVLYLSTDQQTAIKEANISDSHVLYIAKFKVINNLMLRSIFVEVNPFSGIELPNAGKFKELNVNGYPDWYNLTVNQMIYETFSLPDLKNNVNQYKLTLAIAEAFFPLSINNNINYSGWLYSSVAQQDNRSQNFNVAINESGVDSLQLESVSEIKNGNTTKLYLPEGKQNLVLS